MLQWIDNEQQLIRIIHVTVVTKYSYMDTILKTILIEYITIYGFL